MKTRITAGIIIFLLVAMSCREEEKNFPSIEGKWRGTSAEITVKPFGIPIPFSEEDDSFATEIEFKSDGALIIYDGAEPTRGSWQVVDDKLITDVNFSTDFIDLSGTYTIEELTQTKLVFYLEKENETITDPDSGKSISGDVKVTLHFEKI